MENVLCGCTNQTDAEVKDTVIKKLSFTIADYAKALISWILSFRRTFIVEPGLYYTGESYDINSPFLVTCNYHLTVFNLWKILKNRQTRILVIDTQGINVWCSSGKGQFSADEILRQLKRYNRKDMSSANEPEIILPKLSLSGVKLADLKKYGIKPKIGPVYMRDIPEYLDKTPLSNCKDAKYKFTLRDRLFSLVPSLAQMIKYSVYMAAGLFVWDYFFHTGIYWQIIPIAVFFTIIYTVFFPILPSRKFAVKGAFLYIISAIIFSAYYAMNTEHSMTMIDYLYYLFFTGGFIIMFSLSYTGNSGVSNYSLVKKEIVRFLPVSVIFFVAALVVIIYKGVK